MIWPPSWIEEPRFVVFDTETTGTDPATADIVQIAVIQVDHGEPITEWQTIVNPGCDIPAEAAAIHGITNDRARHAPSFEAIANELADRMRGRFGIGYNIAHYDMPVVARHLRRANIDPENTEAILDVLVFVRHFDGLVAGEKGRHKLSRTAERHGIDVAGAHGALADCRMTWGILRSLVEKHHRRPDVTLDSLIQWSKRTGDAQRAELDAYWAKKNGSGR